jgi:hypothetical protein
MKLQEFTPSFVSTADALERQKTREGGTMNRILNRRALATLSFAGVLAAGFFVGRASADQPHMQAALEHLRAAKGQLEVADTDKGGHRAKALRFVNDAIEQVERGIKFDRRH